MLEWAGAFYEGFIRFLPGILIGAWTGYITNDVALRMIFREYRIGFLRFGGVIAKTRNEFSKGVVDLVGKELIRPDILRAQIAKKEFTDAALRCLKDALSRVLSRIENYDELQDFIDGLDGDAGPDGGPISVLADIFLDALIDDGGPFIQTVFNGPGAGGSNESGSSGLAGTFGRAAEEIRNNPEFTAACAEFVESYGGMRVRQYVGERFFSEIKRNLLYLFDDAATLAGTDLQHATRGFADAVAYLLFDARLFERFAVHTGKKTFAELLGLKEAAVSGRFFGERARRAADGGKIEKATLELFDALCCAASLEGVNLESFISSDASGLDAALTGVYACLTGAARDYLSENRAELVALMEESVEHGINQTASGGSGVAGYMRKVVFTGKTATKMMYDRFSAFIVSTCADLPDKRLAGDLASRALGTGIANILKIGRQGASGVLTRQLVKIPGRLLNLSPSDLIRSLSAGELRNIAAATSSAASGVIAAAITNASANSHMNGANGSALKTAFVNAIDDIGETKLEKIAPSAEIINKIFESGLDGGSGGVGKYLFSAPGVFQKVILALRAPLREFITKTIGGIKTGKLTAAVRRRAEDYTLGSGAGGAFAPLLSVLAERLESTVREKVNEAIKNKLDGYRDDELSSLARMFFGQLKHITVLGAIMGAFVGALSSVFSSAASEVLWSGQPRAMSALAIFMNIALYALIGWATNVAALELLFRPRKELKLPGFTLQSVISGNRERFAAAVGRFLANLTEKQSGNAASGLRSERNGDAARDSADRDVFMSTQKMKNALAAQIESAVPSLAGAKQSPAGKEPAGKAPASKTPTGKASTGKSSIGESPIGGTPSNAECARATDTVNITDALCDVLFSALQSGFSIADLPVNSVAGHIGAALRERLSDLDSVEVRSLLRNAVKSSYNSLIRDGFDRPFLRDTEKIRRAIYGVLSGGAAARTVKNAVFKFEKRGYGELLADICERNAPQICGFIRRQMCSLLVKNSGALAEALSESIGGQKDFFSSLTYKFAGDGEVIKIATENFLAVRIPAYVESRADDIDARLKSVLTQALNLLKSQGFIERFFDVNLFVVSEAVAAIFGDEAFTEAAARYLTDLLYNVFEGVTVGNALEIININGPNDVLTMIDPLIRAVAEALTENAQIESEDLSHAVAAYALETLGCPALKLDAAGLFSGVRRDDVSIIAQSFGDAFFRGDRLQSLWKNGIYKALDDGREELGVAVETALQNALAEKSGDALGENLFIVGFLKRVSERFGLIWTGGFARGVSLFAADAAVDAFVDGMDDVVRAVDLQAVAEKRINEMDTGNIERVFRSFAGGYIQKLKLYGLWGGLFGIHPALPLASAALASVNYLISRINKSSARQNRKS